MVNTFSSNSQVAHSEAPKRNSDVIWRCWVSKETDFFPDQVWGSKGIRDQLSDQLKIPQIHQYQRGVFAYSDDVNPVFKKSFCQGPSIGPDLGYIYYEIGFRNFTQISLATIAFRIRTPDFIKNSIVELSFQIGFLRQEQPSTESAQIFKDCRSDHMGMGLGWTPDATNPAK